MQCQVWWRMLALCVWWHTASTNTTPPSVNPEDSLIRGNYAFAFPFIPRVPSPPPSPAMSCSSRWCQPPESCHPVSISSSAVRPAGPCRQQEGGWWRLRRVGTASRLSLELSRLSWHPRCSWPVTLGASQRRASQPPSLPSLPHTAVARRRHPPLSVPPATSSVWCRSCWSWY